MRQRLDWGLSAVGLAAQAIRILIVSIQDDLHALWVREALQRRDVACAVLESDALIGSGGLTWTGEDGGAVLTARCGARVDVSALGAIWWRRSAYPQKPVPGVESEEDVALATSEWARALQGALLTAFTGTWINDPAAAALAENKLLQLRTADGAGFPIPRTLVSQDPERVRDFVDECGGAIVKPVHGSARRRLEVQPVEPDTLPPDQSIALVPAIWQERIATERHLRIHAFGDDRVAITFSGDRLDWRYGTLGDIATVPLSRDTNRAVTAYLRALDLEMAIFDFAIRDDGTPVFLEANQQGQFLFWEGKARIPLTDAFADFLIRKAAEAQG